MNEKDSVLELFSLIKDILEDSVKKSEEEAFIEPVRELAVMLRSFHEEMINVGFTDAQAFRILTYVILANPAAMGVK